VTSTVLIPLRATTLTIKPVVDDNTLEKVYEALDVITVLNTLPPNDFSETLNKELL